MQEMRAPNRVLLNPEIRIKKNAVWGPHFLHHGPEDTKLMQTVRVLLTSPSWHGNYTLIIVWCVPLTQSKIAILAVSKTIIFGLPTSLCFHA